MSYAIILALSFIIPFIFSFEKKIFFISKFNKVLTTIFIVSTIYIIWDIIFTSRGIWSFSEKETIGLNFINIPVEELLFFVIVPYCLLFIYEVINFYSVDDQLRINKAYLYIISIILLFSGIMFYEKVYTFVQFIFTSLVLSMIALKWLTIVSTKNFLFYLIISFIPFLIVNYFLTSIPIVIYNENEIIGLRIVTIPVEDFLYQLSYSLLIALVYKLIQK